MIRRPPKSTRTATLFPTRRSSDLGGLVEARGLDSRTGDDDLGLARLVGRAGLLRSRLDNRRARRFLGPSGGRSEEHTSELQSLMRISYSVFCLKKKNNVPTPSPFTSHSQSSSMTHSTNTIL